MLRINLDSSPIAIPLWMLRDMYEAPEGKENVFEGL